MILIIKNKKFGLISVIGILLLIFGIIVSICSIIGYKYLNRVEGIFFICVVAFVIWLNIKAVNEEDDTIIYIKIAMYGAVVLALLIDILNIADISIGINLFTLFVSTSEITTMISMLRKNKNKFIRFPKEKKVKGFIISDCIISDCIISDCTISDCTIINSEINKSVINSCELKKCKINTLGKGPFNTK